MRVLKLFANWLQVVNICSMENFALRWQAVETMLQERFGKLPDMEGILFLIGINELGKGPERKKWSKEQKQDLMHIAVCKLLSQEGFYEYIGTDGDGWPHYEEVMPVPASGLQAQEQLLKQCIVRYFEL